MTISDTELVDLLEDYGAMLRYAEDESSAVATLETTRSGVDSDLTTNSHDEMLSESQYLYEQRIRSAEAAVSRVASRCLRILGHPTYVLEDASLGSSPSDQTILEAFFDLFGVHSKTIQRNVVTLGSVTMDCDNSDCGEIVLDKKLDGVSVPTEGGFASARLLGLDSEIAFSDSFVATCEQSEPRSVASFRIRGTLPPSSRKSRFGATGYGDGPTLTPIDYASFLQNGRFETFASTTLPTGWTLASGTASTHATQETGASNVWLGSNSLKLVGDGSQASIKLTQSLTNRSLQAGKRYGIGAWVKGNTSLLAGDLKIRLTWTGASLSAGEFIDVPLATLDDSNDFVLYTAFVTVPMNLPSGLVFEILFDGTPTNAQPIYISDVALGEATYFNGVCAILKDGKGRFSVGDTASFDVTNDEGGKFQTFNRDFYAFQWPSSATPNVADSLIS